MNIQKSSSILLSTTPYRESSMLVALLSQQHGRIQGIAKGIRSAGKRTVPLERGMCIEHTVYFKSTREIQTLGDIQIVNFYPEIRESIEKAAARDTMLELILLSVKPGDHGSDVYPLLSHYLEMLCLPQKSISDLLRIVWNFHIDYASLMGFGLDTSTCVHCGKELESSDEHGHLVFDKGGVSCRVCGNSSSNFNLSIPLQIFTNSELISDLHNIPAQANKEWIRLIRLASSYCKVHLDYRHNLKSLDFLEQVVDIC